MRQGYRSPGGAGELTSTRVSALWQAGGAPATCAGQPPLGYPQQVSGVQQGRGRPLRLLPPAATVQGGADARRQPAAAEGLLPPVGAQWLTGHRKRLLPPEDKLRSRAGEGPRDKEPGGKGARRERAALAVRSNRLQCLCRGTPLCRWAAIEPSSFGPCCFKYIAGVFKTMCCNAKAVPNQLPIKAVDKCPIPLKRVACSLPHCYYIAVHSSFYVPVKLFFPQVFFRSSVDNNFCTLYIFDAFFIWSFQTTTADNSWHFWGPLARCFLWTCTLLQWRLGLGSENGAMKHFYVTLRICTLDASILFHMLQRLWFFSNILSWRSKVLLHCHLCL